MTTKIKHLLHLTGTIPTLALLLSSCGGQHVKDGPQPISQALPDTSVVDLASIPNFHQDTSDALSTTFTEVFAESNATGLSACIYSTNPNSALGYLWQGTRGVDSAISQQPFTTTTKFHSGSIGKLATASLILQLIEQEHFTLETTIDRWFPDTKNAHRISVDQLLNHTAGLPPHIAQAKDFSSRSAATSHTLNQALLFTPGHGFSYSNAGYFALGVILEHEYSMPLADVIDRYFISPQNLQHSLAITVENMDTLLIASTYSRSPDEEDIDYAFPGGAGILASTPCDLIHIMNNLLANTIVSEDTKDKMGERMYPMNRENTLNWSRGLMSLDTPLGRVFYLAGRIKGFGAIVAYHPHKQHFISVMVNDETRIDPVMYRLLSTLDSLSP